MDRKKFALKPRSVRSKIGKYLIPGINRTSIFAERELGLRPNKVEQNMKYLIAAEKFNFIFGAESFFVWIG